MVNCNCILYTYHFLIKGSDESAASIFTGEEEIFASQRAVSRLTEMQTEVYWNSCYST